MINAIVHSDYSLRGAPIRVAIFDDRIEIENSALLPWGLTFEDLKSGVSKLRNPVIARVFNEIGLIEQWGSGIKRMTNACLEAGLEEPSFEEIGPRIRVTFCKGKAGQPIFDDLDQLILRLLNVCGPLSTHQITSCVDISRRSVINRLAGLVNKGHIIEIAQSPNDPKKQYSLKGTHNLQKQFSFNDEFSLIKKAIRDPIEAVWEKKPNITDNLHIKIKLRGDLIDLIFSRGLIADYFYHAYDAEVRFDFHDKAEEAVKKVVSSERIFIAIILIAKADQTVQEAFKKGEIAQYYVNAEKFLKKDYRKKDGVFKI